MNEKWGTVGEVLRKLEEKGGSGPWRFQVLESQDAWDVRGEYLTENQ